MKTPPSAISVLPRRFCWTKFGTESGEPISEIFRRKEQERLANDGLFLWGIGSSVAPGVRMLVESEQVPVVAFSPMRSKAQSVDVSPGATVRWLRAYELAGREWSIPEASTVISRATAGAGVAKSVHYALVCRSSRPLDSSVAFDDILVDTLTNARSGNKLGHSQVTSIVERLVPFNGSGPAYPVQLVAELVYPFFVELRDPMPVGTHPRVGDRSFAKRMKQQSLPL